MTHIRHQLPSPPWDYDKRYGLQVFSAVDRYFLAHVWHQKGASNFLTNNVRLNLTIIVVNVVHPP